ncbi:putative glycerophosphoryl diester phosphodiesterase precursor (GlpQ) [Planotetraspora thailandica]|uniref:Putative glycerophosphoryl diester phosphodiesterase (GlpQ) n=1 Tax=Planotetraspora thailandica TaxID=487172 RepID=A0A8J3UX81_9ACTN|nr:glycerophosphodiester phosphodiesterase family protein [Planotetraspora thailandica]GII53578.1 putative glycerophosphoryl diester phosphodiesterase precursor (GlpQ) [Planotetraspora thailandica]
MRAWRRVAAVAAVGGVMAATPGIASADGDPGRPADRVHGQFRHDFDLQAHRGGAGLVAESTLAAFANALELGVSTLELDIQITQDGEAVVSHDRKIDGRKCKDTSPAFASDPEFPYVGKFIKDLTVKQIKTMDCGSQTLPEFPGQRPAPKAHMALLTEVFDLVKAYHAKDVMMNVETKFEAGSPTETAPREQFVQVAAREIREAGMLKQVTIQSFDWGALMRMHQVEPRLPLVALTNPDYQGVPGTEVWLGGLDLDDFGGDPLKAIKSFGASAFSPLPGDPEGSTVTDPEYRPYVTRQLVDEAHSLGIKVIPWTVDDKPTMNAMIDAGVDGIITDYPDRLREIMADRGYKLPKSHHLHHAH